MEHPELNSMEAFNRRDLPTAEMLALSEHLAACITCREAMAELALRGRDTTAIDWFPAEDAALHLSEEEIAAAAQNESSLHAEARTHLASCAACQGEIGELRLLAPVVVMQPKKPAGVRGMALWPVWSGLVAAGIVLAAVAVHLHHAYPPANTGLIAASDDHNGSVGPDAQEQPHGEPAPLAPAAVSQLADLTLPVFHAADLRGGDDDPVFDAGMKAYSNSDCARAINSLAQIDTQDKNARAAQFYRGACWIHEGKMTEAAASMRLVADAGDSPQQEAALYYLAQIALARSDAAVAHRYLLQTIALHGDFEQRAHAQLAKMPTDAGAR